MTPKGVANFMLELEMGDVFTLGNIKADMTGSAPIVRLRNSRLLDYTIPCIYNATVSEDDIGFRVSQTAVRNQDEDMAPCAAPAGHYLMNYRCEEPLRATRSTLGSAIKRKGNLVLISRRERPSIRKKKNVQEAGESRGGFTIEMPAIEISVEAQPFSGLSTGDELEEAEEAK
ncbi:hypothetical protein KM043_013591 [Ampulex compressa]|nr:hypothetical protein KM043_013591 [Ampulex compressa]